MRGHWSEYKKEISKILPIALRRFVLKPGFDVVLWVSALGFVLFWTLFLTINHELCDLSKINFSELKSCISKINFTQQ